MRARKRLALLADGSRRRPRRRGNTRWRPMVSAPQPSTRFGCTCSYTLLAAGKLQLLQFGAGRVGRPYQNEDVLVVRRGCLDERRDAVRAEIRVDGDGILVPGVIQAVRRRVHSAQMTGVCGCRGSDVAALDVAEHVQALLLGVFAGHRVCVDPGRADRLIHGDLRLDRGHDVGDRIDDRPVEFEDTLRPDVPRAIRTHPRPGFPRPRR